MKNLLSLIFLIFALVQLNAQDALMHQFQNSPIYLSPTFSGTACDSRLVANYQNQWSQLVNNGGYHTANISFDKPFDLKNGDKIGAGFRYFFDQAGQADFRNQQLAFAFNYQKRMLKSKSAQHYLIGGFDIGMAQQSLDFLNLRYSSQHDGMGGFDPTLPINETFTRDGKKRYFDLSMGLAWKSEFANSSTLHFGFNLHHINRPNLSFSETGSDPMYIRSSFFGVFDIALIDRFYFSPRMVYNIQGPSESYLLGGDFSYVMGSNLNHKISLGTTFRSGKNFDSNALTLNAHMLNVAYEMKKITLGFNYVFDQSAINIASGGFGGFDVAVIYRFCK